MLERLARASYEHRRRVLVAWIIAFIALGFLGASAAGKYSTDFQVPGSESKAAFDLLKQKFPERAGDSISVIFQADAGVSAPATRQKVEALLNDLKGTEHVIGVVSPYSQEGSGQVSRDGKIAFGSLQLDVQGS